VQTVKPLNTIPLEQFIDKVKIAENAKKKEVAIEIKDAKNLAFTLGSVMSRLHGDLEKLVDQSNKVEEVVNISMDGGSKWK
jgi:mevalonate kinase|tara:strand:+ start:785 stop:1027 length:243 start_codon:yes stop_codon:yes gene_type:complete